MGLGGLIIIDDILTMSMFNPADIKQLDQLLSSKQRIVIFPHTAPDGDALGSTIAWCRTIRQAYPQARVSIVSPDKIERYLRGIPHLDEVIVFPDQEELALSLIAEADLLCHLDHNQISRLRYTPLLEAVGNSRAERILIDHHLYPEEGFALTFSYPAFSSTCELVYCLLKALGHSALISPSVATALVTGIITDTGRFMYGCFDPQLYQHFSELLALGADYHYVIDQLSYHGTLAELRLKGYILHEKLEVYPDLGAAVITLTQEEIQERQITKGDTEGLVNLPLSVEGIDCVCFIREDKTQIKLSFRSIGSLAVNEIAMRAFGGGGHLNAAGGEHQGTIDTARTLFLETLQRLRNEQG